MGTGENPYMSVKLTRLDDLEVAATGGGGSSFLRFLSQFSSLLCLSQNSCLVLSQYSSFEVRVSSCFLSSGGGGVITQVVPGDRFMRGVTLQGRMRGGMLS